MSDAALELLRELVAGQRELLAAVRALRADSNLARSPALHDDQARTALLRALHARAGDSHFSSSELAIDAARPGNESLQAALVRANGDVNARRLGKFLRAIEGVDYGGLRIRRLGQDCFGVIWQCAPWK